MKEQKSLNLKNVDAEKMANELGGNYWRIPKIFACRQKPILTINEAAQIYHEAEEGSEIQLEAREKWLVFSETQITKASNHAALVQAIYSFPPPGCRQTNECTKALAQKALDKALGLKGGFKSLNAVCVAVKKEIGEEATYPLETLKKLLESAKTIEQLSVLSELRRNGCRDLEEKVDLENFHSEVYRKLVGVLCDAIKPGKDALNKSLKLIADKAPSRYATELFCQAIQKINPTETELREFILSVFGRQITSHHNGLKNYIMLRLDDMALAKARAAKTGVCPGRNSQDNGPGRNGPC